MKKYLNSFLAIFMVLVFTGCGMSIYDYSKSNDYYGVVNASKVESVNLKDSSGFTALHRAADNGNLDIVKYLVENGAHVNSRTNAGDTPLIRAAYKGNLNIVKYLISVGAGVNDQSNSGVTPLLTAIGWNRISIVKYLVENGADINKASLSGNTPLKNAKKHKRLKILEYLNSVLASREDAKNMQKEKDQISTVSNYIKNNDLEGLKKYTDKNPNTVYFIEDETLRLMLTGPKGLKVGDLKKLVKKGRSEKIILSLIKRVKTPYKEFNLEEIDILVDMGLSDNIISAMIDVTTELLKDAQRKKEQEYYLAEQKRIGEQNKTQSVKQRVVEKEVVRQNSVGSEILNVVGKEVGKELGKKLFDNLF